MIDAPVKPKVPSISGPYGSDRLEFMRSGGKKPIKRVVFSGHGTFNTRTELGRQRESFQPHY